MEQLSSKNDIRQAVTDLFIADMVDCEDEENEELIVKEFLESLLALEGDRYTYRSSVPKCFELIGELLPNYDERRFRSTVRMSRNQFWTLHDKIKDHGLFQLTSQFPVSVQLLIALHR